MILRSRAYVALLLGVCSGVGGVLGAGPARADVDPAKRRGGKPVVAILPFTSPTQWSAMGRNAEATFVTRLVQTRKVRVIQASMVVRMLRRHGLRFTGVMAPALLKAAKRWLKASYVLTAKLRWTGDAYTLSTHVMDVNTLETTMAEDVDFSDVRKMRIAVRVAARKIAGAITGTGSGTGNADLFLNVNARAFYDTADACLGALRSTLAGYRFRGTVLESDGTQVRLSGDAHHLKPGIPIDTYTGSDSIDGARRGPTVYFLRRTAMGVKTRARAVPDEGFAVGAKASNEKHPWVVAVGRIVDEAADNRKLVRRFRKALLEKLSQGTDLIQIEGTVTDRLASMSSRRKRFFAYKRLFARGVELVLEGKLYGTVGHRRADLKIYSTMTGRLWGRILFETSL